MPVIIVGGGIGGLSLALALARRGMSSVVIEQAARLEPVGAGIQLSPNAMRVLRAMGVEAGLRPAATAPERAEVRDAASGRLLLTNRLGAGAEARWGAPYLTTSRATLQAALLAAVQETGKVELRLGQAVVAAGQGGEAHLSGGEVIVSEALIGCDGLHSVVRHAVVGKASARFTGQTAWRGLARMAVDGPPRVEVWTGPRHHFVRYPVVGGLVNMVAVAEAAEGDVESWDAAGQGERLAATFARWPEPVRATIAAVEHPWRTALYDRPPLHQWTEGSIGLLGDAAHPMLPFLAQGAAMAIEDAWVLAGRLAHLPAEAALQAYASARMARTAKAQAWASRNATLFHLPSPLAGALFGGAGLFDRLRGADPEARFDWLYGWSPPED